MQALEAQKIAEDKQNKINKEWLESCINDAHEAISLAANIGKFSTAIYCRDISTANYIIDNLKPLGYVCYTKQHTLYYYDFKENKLHLVISWGKEEDKKNWWQKLFG